MRSRLAAIPLTLAACTSPTQPSVVDETAPLFSPDRLTSVDWAGTTTADPLRLIARADVVADRLAPVRTETDALGLSHLRVQQTLDGIPVMGGDTIVHTDARGVAYATSGNLVLGVNVSTVPELDAGIAKQALLAYLGDDAQAGELATPSLLIVPTASGDRLVWSSSNLIESGKNGPRQLEAMIDAHTGEVVQAYDALETAAATGTGNTLYSGAVALSTNSISGGFEMRDTTRGGTVTADMRNRQGGNASIFTDADNVWGNGSRTDRASAGADAHYGVQETFDYYRTVHGRNGIANNGTGSSNRVHYGRNYNNAFWSDSCFCMTYGDGDNSTFSALVSIDVAGHEMSHGVTSRTANLTYSGESGGLNEATSDIFGTSVEFFAANANDPGDYLIGEEITLRRLASADPDPSGGKYLRNMAHPRYDGASIDHYSQFNSSLDVHYSSGLPNNVFYLLSEGGRNDTSGLSVTGITRAKAERIWYRALTVYETAGTTFAQARTATIRAATDLFGATSAEVDAVGQAWTACGVN
jgi:zinc metalloprotease ZmpA